MLTTHSLLDFGWTSHPAFVNWSRSESSDGGGRPATLIIMKRRVGSTIGITTR